MSSLKYRISLVNPCIGIRKKKRVEYAETCVMETSAMPPHHIPTQWASCLICSGSERSRLLGHGPGPATMIQLSGRKPVEPVSAQSLVGGVIYLGVLWSAVVVDRETPDCGWIEMREEVENWLQHNKAPDKLFSFDSEELLHADLAVLW